MQPMAVCVDHKLASFPPSVVRDADSFTHARTHTHRHVHMYARTCARGGGDVKEFSKVRAQTACDIDAISEPLCVAATLSVSFASLLRLAFHSVVSYRVRRQCNFTRCPLPTRLHSLSVS